MAKNVNTATQPIIEHREPQHYMGIRIQAPFKGMFAHVSKLSKELPKWFKEQGIEKPGLPILRYHVIDMKGEMDLEYAILVDEPLAGDDRVKAGILPAGRYASLIYTGGGYQGNKTLIEWVRGNGYDFDRWDTEKGDNFRSRYEKFLTDPKIEHRKTKWNIEVAIKLTDE